MTEFSRRDKIYVFLASIFVTSLVTGNLVFQKFVDIDLPFLRYSFHVSVGLLFFPVTFVITDVISEIYGKEKAQYVVFIGLASGVFVMLMMMFIQGIDASEYSKVSSKAFDIVFGKYKYAILSSLVASFLAQIIDVRIFIGLKNITHSKHLWLRNNISTIVAQAFDTFFVLGILFFCDALPSDNFWAIFADSFCFKAIFAVLDTPIVYLLVYFFRKPTYSRSLV